MQEIIAPISKATIKRELTPDTFLRHTNNGNNEIYLINYHRAPNVVMEIGRLREETFRGAGGGTGLPYDLDDNDTNAEAYDQLIAWNPESEEIIAGYRLIKCANLKLSEQGQPNLSTSHYFHFSEKFVKEYLPYTIELGRSFVQPKYQPARDNRKGLFSLDNLWDGLGAIVQLNPEVKYLFGKVTMYPHYSPMARDLLLHFIEHYFPDNEKLVWPINPVGYKTDIAEFQGLFDGLDYKAGYRALNSRIRGLGENIPPLINTYMNLSSTMKTFGTAANNEFGAVEETGILINIDDIFETKKDRHISTYERDKDKGSKKPKAIDNA